MDVKFNEQENQRVHKSHHFFKHIEDWGRTFIEKDLAELLFFLYF